MKKHVIIYILTLLFAVSLFKLPQLMGTVYLMDDNKPKDWLSAIVLNIVPLPTTQEYMIPAETKIIVISGMQKNTRAAEDKISQISLIQDNPQKIVYNKQIMHISTEADTLNIIISDQSPFLLALHTDSLHIKKIVFDNIRQTEINQTTDIEIACTNNSNVKLHSQNEFFPKSRHKITLQNKSILALTLRDSTNMNLEVHNSMAYILPGSNAIINAHLIGKSNILGLTEYTKTTSSSFMGILTGGTGRNTSSSTFLPQINVTGNREYYNRSQEQTTATFNF